MAFDLDTCAELSALRDNAQPAFVWSLNGRALVWANAAAAAFWGAASRRELLARNWADAPTAQGLAQIAQSLGAHAMRLERLRLQPPGRTTPLIVQAHRLTLPDGQRALLTLAMEKAPAARLERLRAHEAALLAEDRAPQPAPREDMSAAAPTDPVSSMWARAQQAIPVAAAAPEAPTSQEAPAELHVPHDSVADLPVHSPILPDLVPPPRLAATPVLPEKPLRFVWQSNWKGMLVHVSPDFVLLVGAGSMPDEDQTLADFIAASCVDDEEQLVAALASGASWTDLAVEWPLSNSPQRALINLSAIAEHDEAGDFEGYRGLGMVRALIEDEEALPAPAPASVDDTFLAIRQALSSSISEQDNAAREAMGNVRDNVVPLRATGMLAEAPQEQGHFALLVPHHEFAPHSLPHHDEQISLQGSGSTGSGSFGMAAASPAMTAQPAARDQSELAARLMEAEQRESELRAVLATATDGVIMLRHDGCIEGLNAPAEALFGMSQREASGQKLTRLFEASSHGAIEDYLAGLMSHGVASVLNDGREVIGLERRGGKLPLFLTIGRLAPVAGGRMCAVLRDISQWKKAEETLTGAKKEAELASSHKSDFLAKISHEIRTPLNAIIGFSEVMMEERFGPVTNERYKGYLKDIHTSGTHLVSLVNDLLDLSKIEAGKMDLTPTSVSLSDMVMQAVAIMQPQANSDGVILRTSLPRTPPVVADQRSVRQILLNLMSNAIRFSRAGGQVILSTTVTPDGEVSLKIRDHGIGMSAKDIAIAMEPFRQVSELGRANSGGTGLGLPLTKALAEANRAQFTIESEKGVGTMVQILFPATRVLAE